HSEEEILWWKALQTASRQETDRAHRQEDHEAIPESQVPKNPHVGSQMCRQDPLNIPPEPRSPSPEQAAQTTTAQSCAQNLCQDQKGPPAKEAENKSPKATQLPSAQKACVCPCLCYFDEGQSSKDPEASPKARRIHQGDSRQAGPEKASTCGSSGSDQGNSHHCFEDSNRTRPQEPASHQENCRSYRQVLHEGQPGSRRLPDEPDCQRCHCQDASNNHYWTSKELQIPEEEPPKICPKGAPQAHQQGRKGTPSA
ncbi:hypothetical protein SNEBB_011302, partial [Seison nebaliae]